MITHTDPKVQAVVNELTEQRNVALDNVAVLKGELAESNRQLAESNQALSVLSAKIEELQKKLDEPESPGP